MSFADLKKRRKNNLAKLQGAVEKQNSGSYTDDREWKPTVDKAGNGYAVIRFLPAGENQDLPWVQYWDHGFKGSTGKWYFEKSLTTLNGQPDPVSELNTQLWNSGREEDKDTVRKRKRRLHYVSNIYVVSDPGNPDNEGKVFFYQYGKKIHDKIVDVMQPQFEDEDPVDPFDFWDGANFKLKIRQVEGYRNYDKSEFDKPSPLLDGDEKKLEALYNQMHDIGEFVDPKTFKSYAELKQKLYSVIGEEMVDTLTSDQLTDVTETQDAPSVGKSQDADEDVPYTSSESSDEDEDLSYFAKLANQE
jgi:hypothetical protein